MLGHCHTCPWLLVSRVPHPVGSPRLFVIQITRVCHGLLYGPSCEEVVGRRGMLGLKWELERWGGEREREGRERKRCRRKWTKGSIMKYRWSALVIKDNREDGDKREDAVRGKECWEKNICPVKQSPGCNSWLYCRPLQPPCLHRKWPMGRHNL